MPEHKSDPYLAASFSFSNRLMRFTWGIVYALLFRPSPRPAHAWRSFLLRCFGATMAPGCHIYPKAIVWAPWNFFCEYQATVADGATVYNPKPVRLGSHAIVSQEAYLCGATHDYEGHGAAGRFIGRGRSPGAGFGCDTEPRALDGLCRGPGAEDQEPHDTRQAECVGCVVIAEGAP